MYRLAIFIKSFYNKFNDGEDSDANLEHLIDLASPLYPFHFADFKSPLNASDLTTSLISHYLVQSIKIYPANIGKFRGRKVAGLFCTHAFS